MAQEMIGTADRRGIVQTLEPLERAPQRRIHYRGVTGSSNTNYAKSANGSLPVTDACFAAWEEYRKDKRNHADEYEVRAFVAAFEVAAGADDKPAKLPRAARLAAHREGKAEAEAEIVAVLTEYGGAAPAEGQTVAAAVRRLIADLTAPAPPLDTATVLRACRLAELLTEIQRRHDEAEGVREAAIAREVAAKDAELATLRAEMDALRPDAERFRQARALFTAGN